MRLNINGYFGLFTAYEELYSFLYAFMFMNIQHYNI